MATIAVIIPTLNAADTLPALLETLLAQQPPPDELVVVDSASTDGTAELAGRYAGVRVLPIARESFDHGGTRDWALRQTRAEFVCFLTQDALPMDDGYLRSLTAPFADERVAAVCGRQVAREDARPEEALTRAFNYPAESFVRSADDLPRLGIKAFFLSDTCSAYRRAAYEAAGGFEHPIRTNEDMLMAARLIAAGWRIAYCAEARVRHSHTLTLRQEYRRNREVGAFLKKYEPAFGGASADAEGLRYVRTVSWALLRKGQVGAWARFGCACVAKLLGSRAGRRQG
ncbi:MAG: glycosyltransferase family 2 protein [Eubacteriales bacterium]|nr:glycosyltransferase family 2 protein [Eubacteriales bacterium]